MFERFRSGAREVVVGAQHQARRLGHRRVGTEHLLLALLASETPAADVLRSCGLTPDAVQADVLALASRRSADDDRGALARLGIDLDAVREVTESTFGPGALQRRQERRRRRHLRARARAGGDTGPVTGHVPFSPRAKEALELSLREALRLGHKFIGPEHLALGLLRVGRGTACTVLSRRDVSPLVVRLALEAALRRAA